MYSRYRLAQKYLQYYLRAANGKGHGVHSPFVFDFIIHVLNDGIRYPEYRVIEELRSRLRRDETLLEVEDLGAGSAWKGTRQRSIGDITRRAAKGPRLGQLLYRIARYYEPKVMLELGTSLGFSAAYLAMGGKGGGMGYSETGEGVSDGIKGREARDAMKGGDGSDGAKGGKAGDAMKGGEPGGWMKGREASDAMKGGDGSDGAKGGEAGNGMKGEDASGGAKGGEEGDRGKEGGRLWTVEGSKQVAEAARRNLEGLGLNVELIGGNFDEVLPQLLARIGPVDLAFVDGNHRKEPTLSYFEQLMGNAGERAIFIFDDIHWSAGMEEAWEAIRMDPRVYLTVDLFYIGLVFLRDEFKVKQNFKIRF